MPGTGRVPVDIAILIHDADVRLALGRAVVALGHSPVEVEGPEALLRHPMTAALVDGAPATITALRACAGPASRLLAIGEDAVAAELLAAGADDVIPAECPPALLSARLHAPQLPPGGAAEIVEHANDIIYTTDLAGRFTFANHMAELTTGYSRHELIGMAQEEILAPEYHELAREMTLAKLHGDTEATSYELEIIDRGGRRVPLEVSTRILYRDGKAEQVVGTARDITRRWRLQDTLRQNEAALQESERFLNAVVQSLPGYVYRAKLDAGYTLEFVSDGIEETTGYRVADFMVTRSVNWPQLVHPDDVAPVEEKMQAALAAHNSYEATYRIFRKSGELRWVWEHGAPLYDDGGEAIAFEGFVTDVTERRQAEMAVHDRDRFLRAILENAPVIIVALDREGRYTFTGGAAMADLGLIADDAVGHSAFERWADLPEVLEFAQRALGGEAASFDWEFKGHTLATNVAPTRDDTGTLTGAIAVSFDNTERKRAERAVVESEAKFRAFAEATSALLLAYRGGELFYANDALSRITGFAREELLRPGFFAAHVVHPEDASRVAAASAKLMRAEQGPHMVEFRLRCADGGVRWVQVSGSTFFLAGERAAVITGFDVTDRKQAEDALRTSEEKFRAYAESTHSALWAFTEEGTFYANQAFLELTGYSSAEVMRPGFYVDVIVHPEDRELLAERRRRRLAGETLSPWNEHRIITRAGDVRWLRMTSGYFSLNGQPAAVATAFDMTDRRVAEEALRESRQQYAELVQSIEAIVWEAEARSLALTFVSPQAERILGYPVASWLDEPSFWAAHVHPDDRDGALQQRNSSTAALQDYACEYRMIAADGQEVWLRDLVSVQSVDGEATTLRGVMIDITEQKRAEQARGRAEQYLRTVLAAAPVVLWAVDQDLRFTLLEGKIPRFDGAPSRFLGKSILRYAGVGRSQDNVTRALAGEAFTDVTEDSGGTWETHYSPLRATDGSVTGVIGVSIDVTERRRAEQAMLQAQKLESLGILAGGIAHDFNNLLVAILGNAGIALAEVGPTSPARETIQEIEKAGQRAAELARQMLAYSGKGRFVVERVNLSTLVEEMTHLLRVSIGRGITTAYSFDAAMPPIEADPTQVRQVVMNLVVNASDAIGAGQGTIAVSTSVSEETPESLATAYLGPDLPGGAYACLEVTDTGCGMDAATLARIFDPFFTTKFTGRGLGLAAALGVIRVHRGAIQIKSQVGTGTTFRVLFPLAAAPSTAVAARADIEDGWRGSGTVLVADDEESVRAVTARALALLGFEVVQAGDGAGAVELVRDQPGIACAILDMTMPGMAGDEVFAGLRGIAPSLPVILMSGYTEHEASDRFPGEQPAAFVQKPYEISTLARVLRRVLEGR